MPIIKSARKRVKVAHKATVRNAKTKRAYKTSLKALSKKPTLEAYQEAQSAIDIAVKKHVIHKNKAARLKSRAALLAKEAKVKTAKAASASKPKPAKANPSKPKAAAKKKSS